jgi:hypothetical protein
VEVYIKRPLPPDAGAPDFENSDELSMNDKIAGSGAVTAVQPRIRLTRSFNERSHTYLGYLLRIEGTVGGVPAEFRVGIGSGTHAKHQLRIGDRVEGLGHRVADPQLETADIYRVSKLQLIRRGEEQALTAPWHGVPLPLPVYRERGHRRLAVTTYDAKCTSCIWGCAMPVEMIIDQWNPARRRHSGNLLLRTSVLFQLQARSHPKGSRSPRHDL